MAAQIASTTPEGQVPRESRRRSIERSRRLKCGPRCSRAYISIVNVRTMAEGRQHRSSLAHSPDSGLDFGLVIKLWIFGVLPFLNRWSEAAPAACCGVCGPCLTATASGLTLEVIGARSGGKREAVATCAGQVRPGEDRRGRRLAGPAAIRRRGAGRAPRTHARRAALPAETRSLAPTREGAGARPRPSSAEAAPG